MDNDIFEQQMREGERFHTLRCDLGNCIILRLDGRSFTKFTSRAGFEKPFDSTFGGGWNGNGELIFAHECGTMSCMWKSLCFIV